MDENINFCFLYGKIISKIDLNFFYNSRWHISKVEFEVEIDYKKSTRKLSKQKIMVKAYDDKADIIYKNYHKDDYIKVIGIVTNKGVEVKKIV